MPDITESAGSICTRIYEAGPFDFSEHDRGWYDQASTLIAFIAGPDEVRYVDHNIHTAGAETNAMIVAFTDHLFIVIDVEFRAETTRDGKILGTRIFPRKKVLSVEVSGVTNAINYQRQDWPMRLKVRVSYPGVDVSLPFRSSGFAAIHHLAALVPSLAKDLNG